MSAASRKGRYRQSSEATTPDWLAEERQRGGGKPQPPDPQLLALLDPGISLEQTQRRLLELHRSRAAASTVEALAYSLRSGVDSLTEPDAVRRLAELSDDQLLEVGERLRRLKPKITRAWSADEVATLIQFRERLK